MSACGGMGACVEMPAEEDGMLQSLKDIFHYSSIC